jgi:hypothetical protein
MRDAFPFNTGHPDNSASRREMFRLIGCCLAACGFPLNAAPESPDAETTLEVDRLWERGCPEKITERAYRVDATVLLLSVPILRRNGVGDARVALRQTPAMGESGLENRLALEFAAASDPARAHGLDRMGWIREVVIEKDGRAQRAGVLGIMSDSPEQTAEEARTALRNDSSDERLVAIDSSYSGGAERCTRSRVIRFRAPRGNWIGGEGLPDLARQSFQSGPVSWKEAQWHGEATPSTFLHALKRSLERGGPGSTEYIWNQNRYTMRIQREADASASREFAAPVDRVHGELQNVTQNLHPLRFQIWTDRESPVPMPLRIEFQPRSFLRLTLEAINHKLPGQPKDQRSQLKEKHDDAVLATPLRLA